MTHISFEQAIADENTRQQYIDQLLNQCGPAVEKLVYATPTTLSEIEKITLRPFPKTYEMSVLAYPDTIGSGKSVPIIITGQAFEQNPIEKHFLSILLDHECVHAEDCKNGLKLTDNFVIGQPEAKYIQENLMMTAMELKAHYKQIDNLEKIDIQLTDYFALCILIKHQRHVQKLREVTPTFELEQKIIDVVKDTYVKPFEKYFE